MKSCVCIILFFIPLCFCHCTKDSGKNPALAFTDEALLDSSAAAYHHYYKNDSINILTGNKNSNGPHGDFKLRFNNVAFKALSDSGRLAKGANMPDGSLVIKDIYSGGQLSLYAIMYKRSGAWLWAEIKPNSQVLYSVFKNPSVCVSCHSQAGNRDFLRTFSYY